MKKILHVISSIQGDSSVSIKLSESILKKLSETYPGSKIQTRNLSDPEVAHLGHKQIASFNTPVAIRTDEQKEITKFSDVVINEVTDADIIVIGVPLYNYAIPSILKAWLDHIIRSGITFSYKNGAPQGLVTGKKVYLAMASGGIFSKGIMKDYDFAEPYLRFALKFIGITDVTTFRAEGLLMSEFKNTALSKAEEYVEEFIF